MKHLFLAVAFLLVTATVKATETLWYYVYFQTEFIQGPWSEANLVGAGSLYLEPKQFIIENAGSDPVLVPAEALFHLRENAPKAYAWDYNLEVKGDTLVIFTQQPIDEFERVKNEVVTTMTHLSFPHVRIKAPGNDQTFSKQDVRIPYFELTVSNAPPIPPPPADTAQATPAAEPAAGESDHRHWPDWLVYGLIGLNVVLLVYLLFGRKKA